MGGGQLFHEVLQANNTMVGLEGLQLEVLLVGHMELKEKRGVQVSIVTLRPRLGDKRAWSGLRLKLSGRIPV